jgi:hypothetical protein
MTGTPESILRQPDRDCHDRDRVASRRALARPNRNDAPGSMLVDVDRSDRLGSIAANLDEGWRA